jgi:hypothetical protein
VGNQCKSVTKLVDRIKLLNDPGYLTSLKPPSEGTNSQFPSI